MDERSTESKQESTETGPGFQILKSLEEPQRRVELASHGTREILVWWDIETCPISSDATSATDWSNVATCLLQELRRLVTCDDVSVTINVYGNGGRGSKAGLDALITSGIVLQHRILPCKQRGSESAALKTMMIDIALWALTTPAPANVFLISAARDSSFRDLIGGMHTRDYNIHLATKFGFGGHDDPISAQVMKSSVDKSAHVFNPMPRHWSVSKQLFAARTAPSRQLSATPSPDDLRLAEKLDHLHLHS